MTNDLLAKMREELTAAPLPEKRMSARSIIFSLMPEIIARREAGMTLDSLVAWFAEHDVKTTRSTLCNYIGEYQRKEVPATAVGHHSPAARVAGGANFKNPFRKDPGPEAESGSPGFVPLHKDL